MGLLVQNPEMCSKVQTKLVVILFSTIIQTNIAVILSCSQSSQLTDQVVDFVSPSFPSFMNEDLTCEVSVRLRTTYDALRIDFVNVTMHGQAPFGNTNHLGSCETDMIFFKGLNHWTTTAKCGELTGYSFLYERKHKTLQDGTFKIVALMSSRKYRWHVRIRQFENPSRRNRKTRNNINSAGNKTASSASAYTQKINSNNSRSTSRRLKTPALKYISDGRSLINSTVPWLVSIRLKKPSKHITVSNCPDAETEGLHLCGGTIISSRFIVTAAHCLYGRSKYLPFEKLDNLKIVVGETDACKDNRRDYEYPSFNYDIKSVAFYYGFDHDSAYKDHDIAIIKLKTSIFFMHHIQPVELNKDFETRSDTRIGLISGFGKWNNKNEGYSVQTNSTSLKQEYFPYYPQFSLVSIAPEFNCSFNSLLQFVRFDFFVGPYLVHYKYNDGLFKKLCHVHFLNRTEVGRGKPEATDSGGPLVSLSGENNTPHLWGIILSTRTRFIYEDAQFYMFLSIARYQAWINAVMYSF